MLRGARSAGVTTASHTMWCSPLHRTCFIGDLLVAQTDLYSKVVNQIMDDVHRSCRLDRSCLLACLETGPVPAYIARLRRDAPAYEDRHMNPHLDTMHMYMLTCACRM